MNEEDFNYKYIKDKKVKRAIKQSVYSRVVIIALLLIAQIVFSFLILLKLEPYIEYFIGGNVVITLLFFIYLSNIQGKNEYKLAWLLPVLIMPIFGLACYILYHINSGGLLLRSKLEKLKKKTNEYIANDENSLKILESFPEVQGIGYYLLKQSANKPHINNQLEYYSCGEDFYLKFLNTLKSAKKFIFLEFFIINIDESWLLILEVLQQKVSEGVEVRILYDALGSLMTSTKRYVKYLNSLGIKAKVFLPLIPFFSTQQNNRDHRKIVIIDGEIGYTGGLNLANQYFNVGENRFPYWKDNFIKIEGSAVQNFTNMFLQTWNISNMKISDDFNKYLNIIPSKTYEPDGLLIPYDDDAYNNEDIAEDVYNYVIENSRQYLYITTPYVILDYQIKESLIFAAKKGVNVILIVPNKPDHLITFCIGRTYIKNLIENSVKVFCYEKGFIHAKTFISDDKIATVGSANLDYRSFFHHFECGTFIYKSKVINEIKTDFENTLNDCSEFTIEQYKKIPLIKRMIGRVFRIFSPLV